MNRKNRNKKKEMSERGICCFCQEECNPSSQSCGRCSRTLTGFSIGLNPLPEYLEDIIKKVVVKKEETTTQKNY